MYVSVEVITMLATAAATLVAIVSGFGWMITRMDARFVAVGARFEAQDAKFAARFEVQDAKFEARFEAQDTKFAARFDAQDAKFGARFDAQDAKFGARFDRVDQRLDRVDNEIFEVKIAIARLEGPTQRLMVAR
jgi:hypothetical protein